MMAGEIKLFDAKLLVVVVVDVVTVFVDVVDDAVAVTANAFTLSSDKVEVVAFSELPNIFSFLLNK